MGYKLTGGKVYDPDFTFRERDVFIKDGVFSGEEEGFETLDVSGMYVIPGLTDIHFHGCKGHDFCEGKSEVIQLMADYEESRGVTTISPATMTYPEEKLTGIMNAAKEFPNEKGAALVGINMEGPFISMEKKGAQNPAYIEKPDADMFDRLNEASGGLIKLVALSPEVPGADEFIQREKERVVISFAHSDADYETALNAFKNGVHHMTHIFNAMRGMHHRNPGPIFAASESGVEAELIADGVHIHPSVVRGAFKLFGEDRVIFISDSMEATGMEDGDYELGGQKVKKKGRLATLEDGTIAGSATDLMGCLKNAVVEMGIPLETAVRCAAVNPAKSIGIYDRYGSIEKGKAANLVILDRDLNVCKVFNRGEQI